MGPSDSPEFPTVSLGSSCPPGMVSILEITFDASNSLGFGAYCNGNGLAAHGFPLKPLTQ